MNETRFATDLPSRTILSGRDRAPARAMLRAVGLSDEDFEKPLIGIANTWTETTPCNLHLRQLAEWVKEGVRMGGGTPLEFSHYFTQQHFYSYQKLLEVGTFFILPQNQPPHLVDHHRRQPGQAELV